MLVLTDYRLQWSDGLNVLSQVRAAHPNAPVIMVTDTGSEEIAAAGMKAGLADYVLKGHLHRLTLVVKESLEKDRSCGCGTRRPWSGSGNRKSATGSSRSCRRTTLTRTGSRRTGRCSSTGLRRRSRASRATPRMNWRAGCCCRWCTRRIGALIERGREVLLAGKPYSAEIRIITKDRQVRWLSDVARPVWDDGEKRVVCIYGAGEDITGRKRAEEERAQLIREQAARAEAEASERRYRSLAEAIPQMVWTARRGRAAWTITTAAGSSTRDSRTGHAAGGTAGGAVLHAEDVERVAGEVGAVAGDGRGVRAGMPFPARRRRGRIDGICAARCRCVDADGRVTKWFGTCTDVDDQRRSSEAMREAQKLESIGLLAGGVAHDFNNLLTGILGNTSLVLDELPTGSRLRPLLENVMLASERAADLTRQLLAYSGKGRFFVQPRDVSTLVREIGSLIQSSIPKKVQLQLELAENLPMVELDSAQMQQLLMNLVINGAEAIGEGRSGMVRVRTLLRDVDQEYIARNHFAVDPAPPGRYVAIQVEDNGCGMEDGVRRAHLRPVLHDQVHGARAGTGGGAGDRAGAQGEHPDRDRARERHACSRCCCPPAPSRARRRRRRRSRGRSCAGAGAILVVDDEELVRKLAKATLTHFGYTVLEAANGRGGGRGVPRARGRDLAGAARHDDAGDGGRGGAGGDPRDPSRTRR